MAKGKQGFASMDPARRAAISRLGGKAAQTKGVAHQWTSEEATAAGRKGGRMRAARAAQKAVDQV
jgi:general stress protein YciG